ncbi:hypothetical protein K435DRAFT_293271 [Dendrothele bispora CBS 962.96]|uniref:Uncharacterized protein n=1 Tax=Dendrothele bispora (strain CBS 962.96) TaxID=1314807 RepID=A0A4S8MKJ6_DENBC|nr:hypothetical protein K435DRAFT_293271 [Dendrothele bispora CBS 962.96]
MTRRDDDEESGDELGEEEEEEGDSSGFPTRPKSKKNKKEKKKAKTKKTSRSSESESSDNLESSSDDEERPQKRRSRSRKRSISPSRFFSFEDDENELGGGVVYRAIRQERLSLGWSQAPCSGCPSFEFCKEGGPVNPQECVYYGDWLLGGTVAAIEDVV